MENPGEKWRGGGDSTIGQGRANAAWRKVLWGKPLCRCELYFPKRRILRQIWTSTPWQWGPWCSSHWLPRVSSIGSCKVTKPHARSRCLNRISQTGCKTVVHCRSKEPAGTQKNWTNVSTFESQFWRWEMITSSPLGIRCIDPPEVGNGCYQLGKGRLKHVPWVLWTTLCWRLLSGWWSVWIEKLPQPRKKYWHFSTTHWITKHSSSMVV